MENRGRNWATIVYQESAVDGWQQQLDEAHVKAFISPIHDKDKNEDGSPKKPHYHVLVMFDGKKSRAQATELFKSIGGVGAECVQSGKSYARYLCHLDEKGKKPLYKKDDVIELGGADYTEYASDEKDTFSDLKECLNYIRNNEVMSYAKLINMLIDEGEDKLLKVAIDKAYVINTYVKDNRWYKYKPVQQEMQVFAEGLVNIETGEVVLPGVTYEE